MKLLCALAGHEVRAEETYNSGYYFSSCQRCGCDVMRAPREDWIDVPAGYRVVWKAGRHSHALLASYEGVLPVVHEGANLPAVKTPFVSWSRDLLRLRRARPDRDEPRRRNSEDRSGGYAYPRLVLLAVAVGAGIQLLFDWVGTERSGRAARA